MIQCHFENSKKLTPCNQAIIDYQKSKNELEKVSLLEACETACADFDSIEKFHSPKNCSDPKSLPIFEKHHPWLTPLEWWVYSTDKNGHTGDFVPPGPPGTLKSDQGNSTSSSSHWENPILNGTEHNPVRINEEIMHETWASFHFCDSQRSFADAIADLRLNSKKSEKFVCGKFKILFFGSVFDN